MDNINIVEWVLKDHKSIEQLRAIRTGLKSLDVANTIEGQKLIVNLTETILARDPNCLEAKVVRAKQAVRKLFL